MRRWVVVVLAAAGCDGEATDKAGSDCDPPDFQATVFTLDEGTGVISGTVSLPDDVPDGRSFEIGLDAGGVYYGAVPDTLGDAETCGATIPFELHDLEAGTFTVEAGIRTASGGAGDLEWVGASGEITVADGETVDSVEITVDLAR